MNQEKMVQQELAGRKRWDYDILSFEYCFITDEQANNIISNETKKGYNSKDLPKVNSLEEWLCLTRKYGLEVRTMKI